MGVRNNRLQRLCLPVLLLVATIVFAAETGSKKTELSGGKTSSLVDGCPISKVVQLSKWTEQSGEMILSTCAIDSSDEQGVYAFSRLDVKQENATKNGEVIWKLHDQTGQGMRSVKLFTSSVVSMDIDGDGEREVFFGYYFPSEGMDPLGVKFASFSKGKKFIVRGQIPMTEDDASLYKMDFDPAFVSASPRLRAVTDSLLKKFVISLCKSKDLEIPVPPQIKKK